MSSTMDRMASRDPGRIPGDFAKRFVAIGIEEHGDTEPEGVQPRLRSGRPRRRITSRAISSTAM